MSLFAFLSLALLAVAVAYATSLVLAVRQSASEEEGPLSSRASAADGGLQVELWVERGPRQVTVDSITLQRETVARAGARPPVGFKPVPADPVPEIEAFEADLDELAFDFPDGNVPVELVEREGRRQHEEWVRLQEADAATTVRWRGRLRVRRRPPSVVLIPMRTDAALGGVIVFGMRYRVGLVGVDDSHTLRIGDLPRTAGP